MPLIRTRVQINDRDSRGLVAQPSLIDPKVIRWHKAGTESAANLDGFTANGASAEGRIAYLGASAALTASVAVFREVHGRSPVVGIDLDGTTADMVAGLRVRMSAKRGVPDHESDEAFPQPDDYAMWLGENAWFESKADFLDHFGDAERSGLYRELPIYGGAALTLDDLVAHGCELIAVTARSAEHNADTQTWIESMALPLHSIINSGFTKHTVEGVDVFLDDAPSVVNGLIDAGRKVVVFDQDYNGEIPVGDLSQKVPSWGTPVLGAVAALLTPEA